MQNFYRKETPPACVGDTVDKHRAGRRHNRLHIYTGTLASWRFSRNFVSQCWNFSTHALRQIIEKSYQRRIETILHIVFFSIRSRALILFPERRGEHKCRC